jgi:hypothetical protein
MQLTPIQRKVVEYAILAAVVAVGLYVYGLVKDHDAKVRAEATEETAKTIQVKADRDIAGRDDLLAKYQAALTAKAATVTTPAAAVQVIEHYIPAPAGSTAVIKPADLTPAERATLPDAPSYTIQTAEDTARQLLQCDANSQALATCTADRVDDQGKLDAQVKITEQWKTAAKGGTKWQRFRAGLGHALCGGAAVGVGSLTGSKANPSAGLIAAGGTFAACELFQLR